MRGSTKSCPFIVYFQPLYGKLPSCEFQDLLKKNQNFTTQLIRRKQMCGSYNSAGRVYKCSWIRHSRDQQKEEESAVMGVGGCQGGKHITKPRSQAAWSKLGSWRTDNKSQFSSVTHSCLTLCNPMDCRTPGLPVHHQHLEQAQTYVHGVGDAIQPFVILFSSCPQPFPASESFSMSRLFASGVQTIGASSVLPMNIQG